LLGKFPDPFLEEICGQPAAIRRAAAGVVAQAERLEELRSRRGRGPVLFTGMGGSYDVCYAPVSGLALEGLSAFMVDAAELLYFRLSSITEHDIVVAVSQSGESAETVRLVQTLRESSARPLLVGVTNGKENTLSRLVDLSMDTCAGPEQGPSTVTFAGAVVALAGIVKALRPKADGQGELFFLNEQAEQAAAALEGLLEHAIERADQLRAWMGERRLVGILARGAGRSAAEMGALTLKEAARIPAESLESAQFRHGPLELAGPEAAVVVIATEPETLALDLRLAGELVKHGTRVLAITSDAGGTETTDRIGIGTLDRLIAPAVSIVPLQLLAWRLAVERGFRPGVYTRASKVTTRE
jgi:glucosamine--fructose-6-phosphate aminotransferase (isomerizing)